MCESVLRDAHRRMCGQIFCTVAHNKNEPTLPTPCGYAACTSELCPATPEPDQEAQALLSPADIQPPLDQAPPNISAILLSCHTTQLTDGGAVLLEVAQRLEAQALQDVEGRHVRRAQPDLQVQVGCAAGESIKAAA